MRELLAVQLAPFGGLDVKRIVAQGPEVFLTPSAMQSLGLVMHELATNATKHGALSSPAGSVTIGWTRDREDHGVTIVWRERGGPPVAEPTHKGFGQVVFERIGASLDGDITTEFLPGGFVCTVTVAANNLLSPARHAHSISPRHAGTTH